MIQPAAPDLATVVKDTRDRVSRAFVDVPRQYYCVDELGQPVHQTSATEMIERMLRLLEVEDGQRLLEIGTGSAFSTAILSHLVGGDGAVFSVDVDREMTERAARLLPLAGHSNVLLRTGDGREGWADCAPFDRLVAWAAAEAVPEAWCEQTRAGAILVVPMRCKGRAWVSRHRRGEAGSVIEELRIPGSFIPLTATPLRPWESTDAHG
jgi:protein-L-isoaspartate(D-aspartate) O-methyltransferase